MSCHVTTFQCLPYQLCEAQVYVLSILDYHMILLHKVHDQASQFPPYTVHQADKYSNGN